MSGVVNSAPVGVENLVYAILNDETTPDYETPTFISPAMLIIEL